MRYITRTIKSVIVVTKCVDLETLEVVDRTFVTGNIPTKNIAKYVTKLAESEGLRLVKIEGMTHETKKHKMSEQEFVMYSTVE